MPLSGGTSGAHDDSMHQGSAKRGAISGVAALDVWGHVLDAWGHESERMNRRGVVDGYAALDAAGSLLVPGSKMYYTRDGSDDVHIYERTSNEEAYAFHRVGADDYTFFVKESNVWKRMQTESMKDVANGIAALDAGGHVLAPGYRFTAARGAAEQITIRERTSDERVFRWIRNGANDYEARVSVGGVEKVVQHAGLKDVADGIAGLDADVKVPSALMPFPLLSVSEFQTNAGTGTATNPARLNDGSIAASVTYAVNGEYVEVLFSDYGLVTQYRSYGHVNMVGDGRFKIQHKSDAAWIDNTLNIPTRVASWSGWVKLTKPVYTKGIRLVATALDTGMAGANLINEMEMIG